MKKTERLFNSSSQITLLVTFAFSIFFVLSSSVWAQNPDQKDTVNPDTKFASFREIAERIIIGEISETKFFEANFSENETLEIFKEIRTLRGWKLSDQDLTDSLETNTVPEETNCGEEPAAASCSQFVELQNGSSYSSYPVSQVTPNSGECGSDSDDIILIYNTPKWSSTNPDRVRVWSNLWWVRTVISSYGGVAANSLCTSRTRVCMGSRGRALGNDLNYLYLWHR